MSFSWSFSKIDAFETCPRRHYELSIRKPRKYAEEESEPLKWGNFVHDQFATAIATHSPFKNPKEMESYQKWLDRVKDGPGETLVEQKFALTKDLEPCEWFGPRCWVRVVVDFLRVAGPVAWAIDWKTGRMKDVESGQLMLTAKTIFSFFPAVQRIKTSYIWLQDDVETSEYYDRAGMAGDWLNMLNRVRDYEGAVNTNHFPPRPGKLCWKWCPVASCEYHGKRRT